MSSYNKLFESLDNTTTQLVTLTAALNENEINTIPFENSWTAAQLATHLTKSNKGIAQALEMHGTPAKRDPAEGAEKLKGIFLDFTVKYKSPEFILPIEKTYAKDKAVSDLRNSIGRLADMRSKVDLTEIINVPAFGETTKLELLYFVLYHSQRHLRQLKNIIAGVKKQELTN